MAYSARDIGKGATRIISGFKDKLEADSEEKGKMLAERWVERRRRGRGLWWLILLPAWLMVMSSTGALLVSLLYKHNVVEWPKLVGFIGGLFIAAQWIKMDFTRNHPFISSIVAIFGAPILVLTMAQQMGVRVN